jgi:hypothetical protein
VYGAFEKWVQPPPQLVGYAFLSSFDIRPLQVADMIAWELYQHANDILIEGMIHPKRKELKHLGNDMEFIGQIATRKSIERLVEFWSKQPPDLVRQAANHFTFFDPENPDYSYLSEK